MRILCIGAFANGNLGDMYQADAIARLLRAAAMNAEIYSVSPSKRQCKYPAKDHHASGMSAFDTEYINTFDMLFVGGGGLLSSPHAPLNDDSWVDRISIPMHALSLGAVAQPAEGASNFVRKCVTFSVRDEYSLAAVSSIRSDVSVVMDPILLDASFNSNFDASKKRGAGISWIPGKLLQETSGIWSAAIKRNFDHNRDWIGSFNPSSDKSSGFEDTFPKVNYLEDVAAYLEAAQSRRLVLSERYHACIYALANGIPSVGVCLRGRAVTSKIEELFRKIGSPDAVVRKPFLASRAEILERGAGIKIGDVREFLAGERRSFIAHVERCIAN